MTSHDTGYLAPLKLDEPTPGGPVQLNPRWREREPAGLHRVLLFCVVRNQFPCLKEVQRLLNICPVMLRGGKLSWNTKNTIQLFTNCSPPILKKFVLEVIFVMMSLIYLNIWNCLPA